MHVRNLLFCLTFFYAHRIRNIYYLRYLASLTYMYMGITYVRAHVFEFCEPISNPSIIDVSSTPPNLLMSKKATASLQCIL